MYQWKKASTLILFAVFVSFSGCATKEPDPLAGWKSIGDISYVVDSKHNYPSKVQCNTEIIQDVQNFIQKLPSNERGYNLGPFQLYEDGTGQHAVEFKDFVGPYTSVQYAIFYDRQNKRIKVVKYGHSQYMS